MDVSFKYRPKWAKDRLTLGVDVFNVTDEKKHYEVDEISDDGGGLLRKQYLSPVSFQTPRYVRFSAEYSY